MRAWRSLPASQARSRARSASLRPLSALSLAAMRSPRRASSSDVSGPLRPPSSMPAQLATASSSPRFVLGLRSSGPSAMPSASPARSKISPAALQLKQRKRSPLMLKAGEWFSCVPLPQLGQTNVRPQAVRCCSAYCRSPRPRPSASAFTSSNPGPLREARRLLLMDIPPSAPRLRQPRARRGFSCLGCWWVGKIK